MRLPAICVLAITFALIGCTPPGVGPSPALVAEKAETGVELSYVAIATAANALEAQATTSAADKAKAEALKVQAWQVLQNVRRLYQAGQDFTAAAHQMDGLVAQAAPAPK